MAPARLGGRLGDSGGWGWGLCSVYVCLSSSRISATVISKLSDLATGLLFFFLSFFFKRFSACLLPVTGSGGQNKSVLTLDENDLLRKSPAVHVKILS